MQGNLSFENTSQLLRSLTNADTNDTMQASGALAACRPCLTSRGFAMTTCSPGVVPPVRGGAVHLQRGVAVAHVDADARAVAEPRQPGRRQGLEPRGRPAQVQAVADVQQVPDGAVVQPVPAQHVGGVASAPESRADSLSWAS